MLEKATGLKRLMESVDNPGEAERRKIFKEFVLDLGYAHPPVQADRPQVIRSHRDGMQNFSEERSPHPDLRDAYGSQENLSDSFKTRKCI